MIFITLSNVSAKNPAGPWSKLHEVKRINGWEDPCPFWDDDGKAYLGHSIVGAGPIIIHEMSPDGKNLLDEGRIVYTGKRIIADYQISTFIHCKFYVSSSYNSSIG